VGGAEEWEKEPGARPFPRPGTQGLWRSRHPPAGAIAPLALETIGGWILEGVGKAK